MMNEEPKLTPRILEVPVLSNVVRFRPSSVGSQADARGILPRRKMNDLGFILYGWNSKAWKSNVSCTPRAI